MGAMYLIHHFIYLRPLMQFLATATVCVWLGMCYCALRLCAYWGWKKERKVSVEDWIAIPHLACVLIVPATALLMSAPDLLRLLRVLSETETNLLNRLNYNLFIADALILVVPGIVGAVYLLVRGDGDRKSESEPVDPFSERLSANEVILWHGNPAQPYTWNKAMRPYNYVLGSMGLIGIVCDISFWVSWRLHSFAGVTCIVVFSSAPFLVYMMYRSIRKDTRKTSLYYSVTNHQLRMASFVRKGRFNYDSLKLDDIDFSRTIRKREAIGIETIYYKSATKPYLDSICFRCIKDADMVDALIRVAYDERMKTERLNAV